jgi:phage/plasmid primase-like uncharacterized protein
MTAAAASNAWAERAGAVPIEDELARRGFHLRGRIERAGPCPVCGGTNRFSINTQKQLWNCRGCGKGGDVIDLVQHIDGCDFNAACTTLIGERKRCTPQPKTVSKARKSPVNQLTPEPATVTGRDSGEDEQRKLEQADAIWRATQPLGPEAIDYFGRRGIDIDMVPRRGGLRFHPRCPWQGDTVACIVGRFTGAIDCKLRGIWRRPLNGMKPKALGPMAGCVIRLWPDAAVEYGLVLGEGVETTLAAATLIRHRGTLLQPAWAACSAGNMESFPMLSGIDALTLLVDNDATGTGQKVAAECAARWSAAGREVTRLTPKKTGTDFNDLVFW